MDEWSGCYASGSYSDEVFGFSRFYADEPIIVQTHSGDLPIHYLSVGDSSRPTIILIHGLGSRAGQFVELANIMGRLAEVGYYVVAPDLPGHGRTPPPTDNRDYRVLALSGILEDFTNQLMSKIDSPSCVVLGHSLGAGAIVVWLVRMANEARVCDKLKGAIVVSLPTSASPALLKMGQIMVPLTLLNPKILYRLKGLIKVGVRAYIARVTDDLKLQKKLMELYFPKDASQMEAKLRFLDANKDSLVDPNSVVRLLPGREIQVPLLFMHGKKDGLFPADSVLAHVQRVLPEANFLIYDNVGHDLIDEIPDELILRIQAFAKQVFKM